MILTLGLLLLATLFFLQWAVYRVIAYKQMIRELFEGMTAANAEMHSEGIAQTLRLTDHLRKMKRAVGLLPEEDNEQD
jgi:hydrogenase/urease accessory protein HupE